MNMLTSETTNPNSKASESDTSLDAVKRSNQTLSLSRSGKTIGTNWSESTTNSEKTFGSSQRSRNTQSTPRCSKQNRSVEYEVDSAKLKQHIDESTSSLKQWYAEKVDESDAWFQPCGIDLQKELLEAFQEAVHEDNMPCVICGVCGELFPHNEEHTIELDSALLSPINTSTSTRKLDRCAVKTVENIVTICAACFGSLSKRYVVIFHFILYMK
jgi:uncharacterized CHY-type Zn-finger protein